MEKELSKEFAAILNALEGKDYLEAMIRFSAAPTLLGAKPATLLNLSYTGRKTAELWKLHGENFCREYRIHQKVLRSSGAGVIIMLYREGSLNRHMDKEENQHFLLRYGYHGKECLTEKLERLGSRFQRECPHEVGVFLGMPVEDVEGFIRHKGQNCLLCKYWKVYENLERAEALFQAYDHARVQILQKVVQDWAVRTVIQN